MLCVAQMFDTKGNILNEALNSNLSLKECRKRDMRDIYVRIFTDIKNGEHAIQ